MESVSWKVKLKNNHDAYNSEKSDLEAIIDCTNHLGTKYDYYATLKILFLESLRQHFLPKNILGYFLPFPLPFKIASDPQEAKSKKPDCKLFSPIVKSTHKQKKKKKEMSRKKYLKSENKKFF